ncbi:nuclear fusion protein [Plasmodium gonderi]|uniref:Nuclear fusion protein n=1 Tax=Plasmodium gonderi TaxID=77519 RepID=A0A1Y1JGG4_PLAGO|nr:nuclear fusion protein [Plasmodium gonderi]GAW81619.1 nuclear fusion protein [Plasmodium gonderi]
MIYIFILIITIAQLKVWTECKFKYVSNTELLVERVKRGKEAFEDVLKAKKKAEIEYEEKKKKRRRHGRNEKNEKNEEWDEKEDSTYVKEIKCYEYVLDQLNNLNVYNCNEINENNKSLLALAKTKCIFVKSVRSFPDEKSGCILNPKKLNKLQIYLYNNNLFDQFRNENFYKMLNLDELRKIEKTKNPCLNDIENDDNKYESVSNDVFSSSSKRNHIYSSTDNNFNNSYKITSEEDVTREDIYLKNILCENLKYKIVTNCTTSDRMSDTAFQIYHSELNHIDDICFYIQSSEWNRRTDENINRLAETSVNITRQMTTNLENMKLIEHAQVKQIENTNRFDSFLKGLKNDFSEVIHILIKIKNHHESITKFVTGFKMLVIYLLILLLVLLITSRSYASSGRRKIISCVFFCCFTELIFKKIVTLIRKYAFLKISDNLVDYSLKGIRYTFVLIGIKILMTTIITYKEPVKIIEEELRYIKKLVEKNDQHQNRFREIKRQNEQIHHTVDHETVNVLNLWLNYNDYLDSIYLEDEDFSIGSDSDVEFSSSDTSLVSEDIQPKEIEELNEDAIGMRIKSLHRKHRPIFFHYFPSPTNVKAYTESPISFTNVIEHNHNVMTRLREERMRDFGYREYGSDHSSCHRDEHNIDVNSKTKLLESDKEKETCSLYDLEEDAMVHKFFSLDNT